MDIGPGGIRFTSNLRFPEKNGVVLQFKMNILDNKLELEGSIAWVKEVSDNLFQYGVELLVDEPTRNTLIPLFNELSVKLNPGKPVPGCDFLTEDIGRFFDSLEIQ